MLDPAPMNNTYALAVPKEIADKYKLKTLSDMAPIANNLRFVSIAEWDNTRSGTDGLKNFQKVYGGFNFKQITEVTEAEREISAGQYRGPKAILRFLRHTGVLTNGTYRSSLKYVVADDERAVAVYRASGERNGRTIDIDQALFCVIRDGLLAEVTAVPFDAAAFDAFWR